jgi:hypothetical protein
MLILLIVGILDGIEVSLRGAVAEWPRPLNHRGPREPQGPEVLLPPSGYG